METWLALDSGKLNAVYDALDRGAFTEAIRLCQKPAISNIPLAQALLAYGYACIKKNEDALDVAKKLIASRPSEPSVISTLVSALKMCKAEREIVPLLEYLHQNNPNNETYAVDLFNAYVRDLDAKKMQLLSQKLYKSTSNSSYLFWSVTCMLLQSDLPQAMLAVAEKMLWKVFEAFSDAQPGSQEIELYVEVLLRQGKANLALEHLDLLSSRPVGPQLNDGTDLSTYGSRRVKIDDITSHFLRCRIFSALPNSRLAYFEHLKSFLKKYPDQWECHQQILDALFRVESDGQLLFQTDIEFWNTELNNYWSLLTELTAKKASFRGPWLAQLQLLVDLATFFASQSSSIPPFLAVFLGDCSLEKKIVDQFLDYIRRFQSKPCCFSDLKNLLSTLANFTYASSTSVPSNLRVSSTFIFESIRSSIGNQVSSLVCSLQSVHERLNHLKSSNEGGNKSSKKPKTKKGGSSGSGITPQQGLVDLVTSMQNEREKIRSEGGDIVTSLAKNLQLFLFCHVCQHHWQVLTNDSSVDLSGEVKHVWEDKLPITLSEAIKLFHQGRTVCGEGVGGDREVLPSDEILLVFSSLYHWILENRLKYLQSNALSNSTTGSHPLQLLNDSYGRSCLIQWMSVLYLGRESSPYSYPFPLELMEALRLAGCGETSVVAFNSLGVKHVQVDTLSFISCPQWMESGFFNYVRDQHRHVLDFHSSARRDTAEMMATSFKHGNFSKALELRKFITTCEKSIQLVISQCDFATMEIVEKLHGVKEVTHYLQEWRKNNSIILNEDDYDDHLDGKLLIRIDQLPQEDAQDACKRKQQLFDRVLQSHDILKFFHELFDQACNESSARTPSATSSPSMSHRSWLEWEQRMAELVDLLKYGYRRHSNSNSNSSSSSASTSTSSLLSFFQTLSLEDDDSIAISSSSSSSTSSQHILWSQEVFEGVMFRPQIWASILHFSRLLIHSSMLTVNEDHSTPSTTLEHGQNINGTAAIPSVEELLQACQQSLQVLRQCFQLDGSASFAPVTLLDGVTLSPSPQELSTWSMFTMTWGCWVPLICQQLLRNLYLIESSSQSTSIKELCLAVFHFLENIRSQFNRMSQSVLSATSSSSSAMTWAPVMQQALSEVYQDQPSSSWESLIPQLADQWNSSYRASFGRLRTLLRNKSHELEFSMS